MCVELLRRFPAQVISLPSTPPRTVTVNCFLKSYFVQYPMKDFFSDMSKLQAEQKPGKGNPKFVPTTLNQSYRISPMDYVLHDIQFTSVTFSASFCNVDCLLIITKSSYEIVSFLILSAVGLEWAFYQRYRFRLPIHHVSVPDQGSCISSNSEFSYVGFDSSSAVLL